MKAFREWRTFFSQKWKNLSTIFWPEVHWGGRGRSPRDFGFPRSRKQKVVNFKEYTFNAHLFLLSDL